MKKHTILFLAANPRGTNVLALDREARAIEAELEACGYRDWFEFKTRWAAEPMDLLRALRKLKPTVVHYSGHGGHDGLWFQTADGRGKVVAGAALARTFGAAGASVKLVVLNACYSDAQAEALLAHVDCVVGMAGAVQDHVARTFAIGFYGGLGERVSVAAAYQQGCAAISLEEGAHVSHPRRDVDDAGAPADPIDEDRARLAVRPGVDASQLVLIPESSSSVPAGARRLEPLAAALSGCCFLGILGYAALRQAPILDPAQFFLLRVMAASAAAACAALASGFLRPMIHGGALALARTGAALAVFGILYLVNPPEGVVVTSPANSPIDTATTAPPVIRDAACDPCDARATPDAPVALDAGVVDAPPLDAPRAPEAAVFSCAYIGPNEAPFVERIVARSLERATLQCNVHCESKSDLNTHCKATRVK